MEAKSFAVGVRAEHPQELINHSQYGDAKASLPAAAYKLTAKLPDGRGVYRSVCVREAMWLMRLRRRDILRSTE